MANVFICNSCKNKITGLKYTYEGKGYCYSCYQTIQEELLKTEQDKQELYTYIKQLFAISEIPQEVVMGIDRELANGKKLKGIKNTLWYYYEICGYTGSVSGVVYTIRDQYENARAYVLQMNKIKEINKTVDINVPENKIVIKQSDLQKTQTNPRDKINYRIEDL